MTDDHSPPASPANAGRAASPEPMPSMIEPAPPMVISPRMRKLGIGLGIVLLAAAIFLEQWCHFQSMPHPTSPPNNASPWTGSGAAP